MTTAATRSPEQRVRVLGLAIPEDVAPAAHYELVTVHGGLLYLSGQLPRVDGRVAVTGCVGGGVSLEQAREGARLCTLRAMAVLRQALGSLDRVERVLKLQVFVHSDPAFTRHSDVADAASDLLVELFGSAGRAARTAIGAAQLPQGASVELDLIVASTAAVPSSKEPSHHAIHR